jgi:hypothetical protein
MNVQELRIENYLYNHDKKVIQVDGIPSSWNCVVVYDTSLEESFRINIQMVEPIPLDEKWLEDFRFKKDPVYETDWLGYGYRLIEKSGRFEVHLENYYRNLLTVDYVHELQNFIFIMTANRI